MNRSFLFVPADSEHKLDKARGGNADALIVDLEDSVAAERREAARETLAGFLVGECPIPRWVRINPIDSDDAMLDLRAAFAGQPEGIVLPKARGAADVVKLAELLDALESEHGVPMGQTAILPLVTERPEGLFRLHEYTQSSERLYGLTWGAEDLGAAVGASATRDSGGDWLAPYQLARSLCLFAAAAAGVAAIDTVYTDFRDSDGLERFATRSRRDGFAGMLAIHPAQVDTINRAFTPSAEEAERARRIVELFAAHPDAGTLALDGEMLDRPHLVAARRVLALAGKD